MTDDTRSLLDSLKKLFGIKKPISKLNISWENNSPLKVTATTIEGIGHLVSNADLEDGFEDAFNLWMDEFLNDPERFESTTRSALRHAKEKAGGGGLTYGADAAACFRAYLGRVNEIADDDDRLVDESSRRIKELKSALKDCVHVIEKGIAVRIGDHWPVLKGLLPDTLKKAKEALKLTQQI